MRLKFQRELGDRYVFPEEGGEDEMALMAMAGPADGEDGTVSTIGQK